MKRPRITFRKAVLFTAVMLVANTLVMLSTAQRRWAEQRAAFELKINESDPGMLKVLNSLKCDGYATDVLPAAKAHTLRDKPRTLQCFISKSKNYKFLSFALEVSNKRRMEQGAMKQDVVCLSSQLSVDGLFWVSEQMKTWHGRFSLAVFIPDVDFTIAMLMIRAMEFCDERMGQNVDFHFLYPVDMPPVLDEFEDTSYNCSTLEQYNKQLVDTLRTSSFKKTIESTKYPQNLLRNIARERCLSEYSFTPDIDMTASPKLYEKLKDFLLLRAYDSCDKCAYIVPTYEIANGQRKPNNKHELLTCIKKKKARRFHVHVYGPNQANSNLSLWEVQQKTSDVNVLYNITSYGEFWEPIYVARASVLPKFGERFVGYGFTRNSQVMEMEAAGYSWFMLDSPFLSHRGFQNLKGRSSYRMRQIFENSREYKKFKSETLKRYGLSPSDPRFRMKAKKKEAHLMESLT